jgi:hypothetical protein
MKMGYEQHLPEHIPYGRARGQHEVVNGRSVYFKSQVEVRFATILQRLQQASAIVEWDYEGKEFWFDDIRRGTCSYRPDFRAVWPEEGEVYYETKSTSGLRQRDVTKFRRMAKRYPDVKLVLVLPRKPSQGHSKSAVRQRILLDKASRYIDHVWFLGDNAL